MVSVNQYIIIVIISAVLALITLIVKLFQKQSRHIIFLNIISSILTGILFYYGVGIIYLVINEGKKTLFNQSITIYYDYIAIAGVIFVLLAIYAIIEILLNKEGILKWIKKEK